MKIKYLLAAVLLTPVCAGAAAVPGTSGATNHAYPAAFPKGHYAALEALPDWGGVWVVDSTRPGSNEQPALKGKYLADYQMWAQQVKATHGNVPHEGSYCLAPGMPTMMGLGQYPLEFLFTPGRVTIHFEAWMQWRNIFTDGREHPDADDLDPTFYGDSIGHWDGGTLVVDTVGVKTIIPLSQGMKHSDKLHLIERIHLAKNDPNTLVDEMTLEDADALAKPWHLMHTYRRSRDMNLLEFMCEENDRTFH